MSTDTGCWFERSSIEGQHMHAGICHLHECRTCKASKKVHHKHMYAHGTLKFVSAIGHVTQPIIGATNARSVGTSSICVFSAALRKVHAVLAPTHLTKLQFNELHGRELRHLRFRSVAPSDSKYPGHEGFDTRRSCAASRRGVQMPGCDNPSAC